jgi:hypothetical protein
MNINLAIRDYVQCITNNAVTYPNGGSWMSALCLHYSITEPVNGSWVQAYCNYLGITTPVNASWTIALANYYSIAQPVNGSWWYAIADDACNGGGPGVPFVWNTNTNNWEAEIRTWSLT